VRESRAQLSDYYNIWTEGWEEPRVGARERRMVGARERRMVGRVSCLRYHSRLTHSSLTLTLTLITIDSHAAVASGGLATPRAHDRKPTATQHKSEKSTSRPAPPSFSSVQVGRPPALAPTSPDSFSLGSRGA